MYCDVLLWYVTVNKFEKSHLALIRGTGLASKGLKKIKSVYNDKHFSKIIIRHWKKTIFYKCNFLIIIFFSQIAQATTLEKFNLTCFSCRWHNKNISFCSIFSNHNVWNETLLVFRVLFSRIFFKLQRLKYVVTCFPRIIFLYLFKSQRLKYFVTCVMLSNIFPYFFKNNSFSSQNLFFTSFIFYLFLLQNVPILQHAIASKSNLSNTMLPNVMVLAPLQKLKIKYELSYQSTTRLKYIDKFDQLLITPQWTSTVDNTVRSLIHLTIFYLILCSKTFPIIYKIIIK
jgi:hypothetical protein